MGWGRGQRLTCRPPFFHLEFGHGPKQQLIYGVGIGGVAIVFISHEPFAIDFFEGEVGEFGVIGAEGDFIDLFG